VTVCQSLSKIMLRTRVFWAYSGINVRIHSNFSANLRQKPTLYQNGSYFPKSLNCSILRVFWIRSLIAKLILQDLWQLANGTSPFLRTYTRWIAFRTQMSDLNHLRIPWCVKLNAHQPIMEVQGFCDTSQRAFEACIYLPIKLDFNDYYSELLCSKSRIAPLKTVSLPRLKLSVALLARLINKVREWNSRNIPTYLWSDSMIALNWITSLSRRWSVFVANRVGEIQRLTKIKHWRHVASSDNPADILSRGLNSCDLINAERWWNGPEFLKWDEKYWPPSVFTRLDNDLSE